MKLIVTGSEGFIGKELVRQLVQQGHTVIGCDRKLFQEVSSIGLNQKSFKDIDGIIHLAAQTSVFNNDVLSIEEDNIKSFIKIVEISNALSCRLIYASSSCAYNVTSMYGLSKKFNEDYAGIYANNAVGVRFHNVYGPNQRRGTLLSIATECLKENKSVVLFNNGLNRRHFTYIDDVVRGIVKLLRSDYRGIINICNPQSNTTREFIDYLSVHMPIKYSLTNEIKKFDKEEQIVDWSIGNVDIEYTSLKAGIYKTLISNEQR